MSNLKDKILSKDVKIDKDKITVSISLKECTWKNGDRPVTINNKSVLKMLIDEGHEIKSLIEGDSLYNDLHNFGAVIAILDHYLLRKDEAFLLQSVEAGVINILGRRNQYTLSIFQLTAQQ